MTVLTERDSPRVARTNAAWPRDPRARATDTKSSSAADPGSAALRSSARETRASYAECRPQLVRDWSNGTSGSLRKVRARRAVPSAPTPFAASSQFVYSALIRIPSHDRIGTGSSLFHVTTCISRQ